MRIKSSLGVDSLFTPRTLSAFLRLSVWDAHHALCVFITAGPSERGGEGHCVNEGGGVEGERERERALGLLLCHSPRH